MKNGLLLINIGTPKSPDIKAVRAYLREFLADKRVVDLSAFFRYLLLYVFILPFRPKKSQKAYQAIWTDQGAPLLVYSQKLVLSLQERLGDTWQVALGMRYGEPSLEQALLTLQDCDEITILPLYPQYASASTGSSLEKVFALISRKAFIPPLRIIHHFYDSPPFIAVMANTIASLWAGHEHIIFSYHGLPERHIHKTGCKEICEDACEINPEKLRTCYRAQCFQTSSLLAQRLNLKPAQYSTTFQSRLGKTPWIKPFTDGVLTDLYQKGIRDLLIACPSFVTDCLETLEEIGIGIKEQWLHAGGRSCILVPCMNDDAHWVDAICSLVE